LTLSVLDGLAYRGAMCLHLDATAALSLAGWVREEPTRSASAPVPQPLVGGCDQLV